MATKTDQARSDTQRQLLALRDSLREANPTSRVEATLEMDGGGSVGSVQAETFFLLYSTTINDPHIYNVRFPDGRCHTFPVSECHFAS